MKNSSLENGESGLINETYVVVIYATATSIFSFGGMYGGLFAGTIAEKFGRKWGIILNNLLVFAAAPLMGQ